MTPSPQQQAISARLVVNKDVQDWVNSINARLTSQYHESILVWKHYKETFQGRPDMTIPPIPDPPNAYDIRVHQNTPEEANYDANYPGIPPRLEDYQSANPICPKYVDTDTPSVAGPVIGNSMGGGWFAAGYTSGGAIVNDASPAGVTVQGTSRDGVSGTFQKYGTVVGPGWWLKIA